MLRMFLQACKGTEEKLKNNNLGLKPKAQGLKLCPEAKMPVSHLEILH